MASVTQHHQSCYSRQRLHDWCRWSLRRLVVRLLRPSPRPPHLPMLLTPILTKSSVDPAIPAPLFLNPEPATFANSASNSSVPTSSPIPSSAPLIALLLSFPSCPSSFLPSITSSPSPGSSVITSQTP